MQTDGKEKWKLCPFCDMELPFLDDQAAATEHLKACARKEAQLLAHPEVAEEDENDRGSSTPYPEGEPYWRRQKREEK